MLGAFAEREREELEAYVTRRRADTLLAERGLLPSRSAAATVPSSACTVNRRVKRQSIVSPSDEKGIRMPR